MRTNNNCLNTFKVNYIIYEKNDTAVLLEGIAKINNKKYHTTFPIDLVRFTYLCEKAIGLKKTNSIWDNLLKVNDQVSELSPRDFLGHQMIFSGDDSYLKSYLFNQKIA